MTTKSIPQLLNDALLRIRQRCYHKTSYSHDMLIDFIRVALESSSTKTIEDLEIWIPIYEKKSKLKNQQLSHWPSGRVKKEVIRWLNRKGCRDSEDFLNGACEPLALYLSKFVKEDLKNGSCKDFNSSMKAAKMNLEKMEPFEAARTIFEQFTNPEDITPLVWGVEFQEDLLSYMFGTQRAKENILKAFESSSSSIDIMPLYMLNYIFDGDELTDKDLASTEPETAQYSCHVVGLVFDRERSRIIVVDPNGPLIPGSSMEFLQMPLELRTGADISTKLSKHDLEQEQSPKILLQEQPSKKCKM